MYHDSRNFDEVNLGAGGKVGQRCLWSRMQKFLLGSSPSQRHFQKQGKELTETKHEQASND